MCCARTARNASEKPPCALRGHLVIFPTPENKSQSFGGAPTTRRIGKNVHRDTVQFWSWRTRIDSYDSSFLHRTTAPTSGHDHCPNPKQVAHSWHTTPAAWRPFEDLRFWPLSHEITNWKKHSCVKVSRICGTNTSAAKFQRHGLESRTTGDESTRQHFP